MSGKNEPHEQEPAPEGPAAPAPAAPETSAAGGLQAERDDLLGRLQRVSAEFLNYKKRMQREMDGARQYAATELIKELLPVLDDVDRAMAAWRKDPAGVQALADGLQLMQTKLAEAMGRHGLTPVPPPVGQPFDPHVHSAILQQPSGEVPEHTVLAEVRRGYQIHGRTIRPAEVVVSRRPDSPADQAPGKEAQ